ncbi:M16 family metallopeptidase [Pseudalkalibacillus salsuginis]|uniref:M16 family metallopeptidase n=1 Tax=Pseudalkalibacillus salsuginis TaxID=2910972 RepID=UPI001F3C221A|nr:pitrilysin family protein [Pseudalkalibacillus salsuginis]MCF6410618.1 insulinase family protein [Pseudalkalibacillus salsuginis]
MITKHTCKNGVRIVTENIPSVRSVAIGIWIGTGSRFEDKDNNGISHFLEHMFFKGTKTRSAREIAESFDSIGGQVNAFTSKEYTCYYAKVLDNHASHALETLSDMFFNSTFDEDELLKEKNVVLEEIKMYEDTPDDIVHDLLSQATYSHHPLAYPILGTEDTLSKFNGDTLRAYMDGFYIPDNVVISVAGNVDDSFIQEIERHFGGFTSSNKKPVAQKPAFYTEKKVRKKDTEQAHLCIGFEGLPVGDQSIFDLIIINNIFGGSMSSRLFQEVREQRGLAYSVFSYHSAHLDTGVFNIYAGTAPGQLDEVYDTISNIIRTLKDEGVTEKEVANSKEQIKGSLMLSLESTNSRMSRNGKHELLLRKHRSLDEILQSIDAVTKVNVDQLIRRIFTDDFSSSLISPKGQFPKKFPN